MISIKDKDIDIKVRSASAIDLVFGSFDYLQRASITCDECRRKDCAIWKSYPEGKRIFVSGPFFCKMK